MTILLINSENHVVLSAQTEHVWGKTGEMMPVTFEGNRNLLIRPATDRGNVGTLVSLFTEAAGRHKLKMSGDYDQYCVRDNLV